MGRVVPATAEGSMRVSGVANTSLDLSVSRETDEEIERLAKEIRGSKADVFATALALLKLAVNARNEGKRVAIVDKENHIDTEITGL